MKVFSALTQHLFGNFFAGYFLGFSLMVLMPNKMFQKVAIAYYDYLEVDDVSTISNKSN